MTRTSERSTAAKNNLEGEELLKFTNRIQFKVEPKRVDPEVYGLCFGPKSMAFALAQSLGLML